VLAAEQAGSRHADPRFDAVGRATADAVASRDVPGALSVVWEKGRVRCVHSAGVRDLDSGAPIAMDTVMGIASMSKPVTVATAMRLVERGRMNLDDPVTRWAPEFASMRVLKRPDGPLDDTWSAPRVITIEDLMTHRSGLTYAFTTTGPLAGALMAKMGMGIDSKLSADEWLRALAGLPLVSAPGEQFSYGHSIDVLGLIIGRVTGHGLRRTMREELLAPLGMEDTDFWVPPAARARAARAYYSPAVGQFTPVTMGSSSGDAPRDDAYFSGGQGLVSTPADYLKFARFLIEEGKADGRRVLRAESVRAMATDRLTAEQRRMPAFGDAQFWDRWGQGLGMTVLRNPQLAGIGGWWQADPARRSILLWMQHCLPAPPMPGATIAVRDIPGIRYTTDFQRRAYGALG
jgi:CubicO group peptidase (beta-lactamase class C family)